jgi:hypothetical protein
MQQYRGLFLAEGTVTSSDVPKLTASEQEKLCDSLEKVSEVF